MVDDSVQNNEQLVEALNKLSGRFEPHIYIIRGFVTGIFQALGATVGFALLIAIVAAFVDFAGGVPFLNYFLEETRLNVIIDNQLKQIEEEQNEEVSEFVEVDENGDPIE